MKVGNLCILYTQISPSFFDGISSLLSPVFRGNLGAFATKIPPGHCPGGWFENQLLAER